MPIVRALDAVRAVPWAPRSLAATAAAAVLVAASWLPATVAAAAPASLPALQGQASAYPSPSGLRLPESWTVQFEHPQYGPGDDLLPYAAVDPPDPDAGFGMLHRLPPAPDAEAALKQRLDFFRDGIEGPMQVRRVDMQPSPNAESTAAAIVLATDEELVLRQADHEG